MKKILLFAAAAMVSLSSCVQTDEVYTGNLKEIGFKAGATRAAIEDGKIASGDISVYGAWDADAEGTEKNWVAYFTPNAVTKFVDKGKNNVWSGDPSQYWPNTGHMQFIAHYPHNAGMTVTLDPATGITGYAVAGIAADSQEDVLFSDRVTAETLGAQQSLIFHHAKALLKLVFKTSIDTNLHEVKLESAKIADVVLGGDLTVTTTGTSTAQWSTASPVKQEYEFTNVPTGAMVKDTPYAETTSAMVVPGKQTALTIVYTLNGEEKTATVDLSKEDDWVMGHKYTYTLTITSKFDKEILFDCKVDTWVPGSGFEGNI